MIVDASMSRPTDAAVLWALQSSPKYAPSGVVRVIPRSRQSGE